MNYIMHIFKPLQYYIIPHLLIRHRIHTDDIRDLGLAEPAELTLKLQSGERLGHFPTLDMTGATGGHPAFHRRREHDIEHVLAVGLTLQSDLGALPVPHGD